ncbi:MAG: CUB domain-containing protein [Anaerolineales bacterium]|nr:CUB domain-containing protein [Anaerolineales bacterium]
MDGVDIASGETVTFTNNIIGFTKSSAAGEYFYMPSPTGTLTCNYNIYYNSTDTSPFYYNAGTRNWSYWTSTLGYEANGYGPNTNPLFDGEGGSYASDTTFMVNDTSDAVDNGIDVGITTDYSGTARDANPDIGAYEIEEEAFTILQRWDFESLSLDASFDITDMQTYIPSTYGTPNYMQAPQIVEDEINGVTTKVLKITHAEGFPTSEWYYSGLNWNWNIISGYTELMFTSNIKLERGAISTPDLKLHGFAPSPGPPANQVPAAGYGYRIQGYCQQGFEFNTYLYDRTESYAPHDGKTAVLDSVYLTPGVWYNMTIRVRQNDLGEYNGLVEIAIDGVWANQVEDLRIIIDDTATLNGIGIKTWTGGGYDDGNQLIDTWYLLTDNLSVWVPTNDSYFGTVNFHPAGTPIDVPDSIVDNIFDYDALVTTETTLTNTEFGGTYSPGLDEQYTIDAGDGNTATITFQSSSQLTTSDYLFVFDGRHSNSNLLGKYTAQAISNGVQLTSTGRYMHLYFMTYNESGGSTGWSVAVTHNYIPWWLLLVFIPKRFKKHEA